MEILGVRVDNLDKKEILEKIEVFLTEDRFHQLCTVNPEFILEAQLNEEFKSILNGCDLNIADGIGLKYAFLRNLSWLKARIAGVDLAQEILRIADKRKLSVFLVVNKSGLSNLDEVHHVLSKKYPNIIFGGECIDSHALTSYEMRTIKYDILLCNFGAPKQEFFINSSKNDTIRLAMGIGGTFDFISGRVSRAPKIVRFVGLEWLWRMFFHPSSDMEYFTKRLKRVFNATIVFPCKVIFSK